MNKITSRLTAITLSGVTSALIVCTAVREKGAVSYQENRPLAEFPEFSISKLSDGTYTDELGAYLTDHFAFRSKWLAADSLIETNIGESTVNGVYAADNMLLALPDGENFNAEKCAAAVNEYAEDYNGTVYFAAIPTSSGVYSEKLPEYIEKDAEKKKTDNLYDAFSSDVRRIDAYNILKMLNENYIYYRNDTRWTSYGAYCVYRTVIQKLGFLPTAYDKYTIEHASGEFRGNLYNKSQYTDIKADIIDIYSYDEGAKVTECTGYRNGGTSYPKSLYEKSAVTTNNIYRLYLGEPEPLVKIKTDVNNERKLLVIKDSYADCFIPFLTQHYSEIAVVTPEELENDMSRLIDRNEYEQTLFLFGIENIEDTDFSKINR